MINSDIVIEKEIGRIESLKHVEWLLAFLFFYFGFINKQLQLEEFVFFLLGTQLPDILEGLLFKFNIHPLKRRKVTHTFILPLLVLVICTLTSINYMIVLGCVGHLIIDLLSGGDPIYLFSPINNKYNILIINKEKRLNFGNYVYKNLGSYWEEQTNADLAWFWVMQLFGSSLCVLAFVFYLL